MRVLVPLVVVVALTGVGWALASWPAAVGGVLLLSLLVFLVGMSYRLVHWARSPVPFRIPTVCGQQKSLPWIKHSKLESPHTWFQVVLRMFFEVVFFRSLFRNTKTGLAADGRAYYLPTKLLWLGALAFHWSFAVIVVRHLRFFLDPVPGLVKLLEAADGLFQVLVPSLMVTDVFILAALIYLLGRRLFNPQVKYVSLAADYFPLFLLLGIVISGVLMRYVYKVDLLAVKELAMKVFRFQFSGLPQVDPLFGVHAFLVATLLAYFPFSKLVHMGGVFMSPTRNLANNSRQRRHVNPWNRPVPVHTYKEWEEEFRDKLIAADIPLDEEGAC